MPELTKENINKTFTKLLRVQAATYQKAKRNGEELNGNDYFQKCANLMAAKEIVTWFAFDAWPKDFEKEVFFVPDLEYFMQSVANDVQGCLYAWRLGGNLHNPEWYMMLLSSINAIYNDCYKKAEEKLAESGVLQ